MVQYVVSHDSYTGDKVGTIADQLKAGRDRLDNARTAAVQQVLIDHGKQRGGFHNEALVTDVALAVQQATEAAVVSILETDGI